MVVWLFGCSPCLAQIIERENVPPGKGQELAEKPTVLLTFDAVRADGCIQRTIKFSNGLQRISTICPNGNVFTVKECPDGRDVLTSLRPNEVDEEGQPCTESDVKIVTTEVGIGPLAGGMTITARRTLTKICKGETVLCTFPLTSRREPNVQPENGRAWPGTNPRTGLPGGTGPGGELTEEELRDFENRREDFALGGEIPPVDPIANSFKTRPVDPPIVEVEEVRYVSDAPFRKTVPMARFFVEIESDEIDRLDYANELAEQMVDYHYMMFSDK